MSSEARRRANQSNAQRSTGPRSAKGKARASRNALRHGLNIPVRADPVVRALANEIAAALHAAGLAQAEAERVGELVAHLERIHEAKRLAIAAAAAAARKAPQLAPRLGSYEHGAIAICAALPQLLVLDSYDRKAQSRLRRILRKL